MTQSKHIQIHVWHVLATVLFSIPFNNFKDTTGPDSLTFLLVYCLCESYAIIYNQKFQELICRVDRHLSEDLWFSPRLLRTAYLGLCWQDTKTQIVLDAFSVCISVFREGWGPSTNFFISFQLSAFNMS